ncbi:hypothetical protein AALH12_03595 [Streptococcus ferus]|uniref:hypothetical protein n=1 Tax=Streptococcus ferus TaxID=1345 RepID=UPI003517BED8
MAHNKSLKKSNGELGPSYVTFSGLVKDLGNESIIMLQVTEEDYFELAKRAIKPRIEAGTLESENLDSIFTNSKLRSSKMYTAFVNYFILRLTAVLELYFKDSIEQLLKLNVDLLAKGVKMAEKGKLVEKLDENYDSETYLRYLSRIATYYSCGKKFSGKYKKYSKFLEIEVSNTAILEKLDNLFSLRNDIAHLNRFSDDEINAGNRPQLVTENGFQYSRETLLSREDFHEVIKTLINLTSETAKFLKEVEMEINSKWTPRYESPEYHYTRLLKKLDQ